MKTSKEKLKEVIEYYKAVCSSYSETIDSINETNPMEIKELISMIAKKEIAQDKLVDTQASYRNLYEDD